MNSSSILLYLLNANLLLIPAVLFYRLLLARLPNFRWNRIFLLSSSLVALILPLIRIPSPSSTWQGFAMAGQFPELLIQATAPANAETAWNWIEILLFAYLVVASLLFLRFLVKIAHIGHSIATAKREKRDEYTLVHHPDFKGPASFFHFLFWNSELDRDPQRRTFILAHERCHIRQGHSFDMLGLEILVAACWFNPAVYLLRIDLKRTHEFLADQAALRVGGKDTLKRLVLASHLGHSDFSIANPFNSQIKARLTMMNLNSPTKRLGRYLLILPLGLLLFACSSIEADPPEITEMEKSAETGDEFGKVFDQNPEALNLKEVYTYLNYPEEAKEKGITGKVVARVTIDIEGNLEKTEILNEAHPLLTAEVMKHIDKIRFSPGIYDDKPVRSQITIPFAFKM